MSVGREITVKGIVVGRRQSGEGSVRVSVYTDALGLISALAKSAREERSKLRPHLQAGTTGTFTFVKGRDVWRVTGAVRTSNVFFALGAKSDSQESVARVLKTVRHFIRGEGSDPYLFSVLFGFLNALPVLEDRFVVDAECVAVLRMLSALGYVRDDEQAHQFLSASYDTGSLEKAQRSRTHLVSLINEGINASGL